VIAVTPRGQARREQLLHAAAELVAQRGFHAVGIAEIGAAAGVTGSAIYRHFASKEEMLSALFDRVLDELVAGAAAATSVEELVERHVDFALRERALIKVWSGEAHNLPTDDRQRFRRKQRAYAEIWTDALVARRRRLSRTAAKTVVHGVFGLVNSVSDYRAPLPNDELAPLLHRAALAALSA
jgi:AcrR family transcriptional regulator